MSPSALPHVHTYVFQSIAYALFYNCFLATHQYVATPCS